MKRFFLFALLFLQFVSIAQKIKVKTVSLLPQIVWESSGLVSGTDNSVWTHNDSGGEPMLYKLNSKGEIIRKIYIKSVTNTDWEDLANDYNGNIYIADIGNNLNKRKHLQILKIPHPDSTNTDTIRPQIIQFKYENQKLFPPKEADLNFDAEALIAYDDSLFIFTKNRSKPYSKYTYVYAIPNKAGEHIAILQDSIYLPRTKKLHSWITGASRHPNKDVVVLISHRKAWLITNFRNKNEQTLTRSRVSGIYSQKEAITFDLEGNLWISNEKYKCLRAKLKKSVFTN